MAIFHLQARARRHRRKIVLALLFLVAITGMAFYIDLFSNLPPSDALIKRSLPDTTKILDRNGKLLYEILDPRAGRRTRVPLSELPLNLEHAVVATEDGNFYQHPGIDPVGILRALIADIRAGHIVAGGSTITQQLARDVLLSREESDSQTFTRKLREAVLAIRLTQAYSKDTILEMYLNESYFGQLAYGAEAASRAYFGKPARDLDLAECALLAGLIQSPWAYDPLSNLDAARSRQKIVLDLMVKRNYISAEQARVALAEPFHFVPANSDVAAPLYAPHFVAYVRDLLEAEYGAETVNHGGLTVVTTLDLDLQNQAQRIVQHNLSEMERRHREENAPDYDLHDAALVALKPDTGEILAMVGSADYFDASIDGAVNVALAQRQPGSSIKPITYATALARDLTPASIMVDVPTSFQTRENEPYQPQNYDRTWHGPISLRTALATSSNLVAVKVLDHVGLNNMIATARALGISTFNDPDRFGLSLTLGGGEVKLLELTAAYAGFANSGRRVEPVALLSVKGNSKSQNQNSDSGILNFESRISNSQSTDQAISPQVAYLITNILSDDQARIGAFGEDSVLNLSRPAAAKTGTTTDFRDNWTLGYTPDLAVGVWAGNANNDPMYKISGITGAAPIWHDFMEEALRGKPVHEFQRPDGIVSVEVCETSGLLPTEYCPRRRTEVFIAGTEPREQDDSYRPFEIDSATGLLWTDGCKGRAVQQVYRLFPAEANDWARQQGLPEPPDRNCLGQPIAASGNLAGDGNPAGSGTGKSANGVSQPAIILTSPAPNSSFELSPQIPAELQQVEVSARLGTLGEGQVVQQVLLLVDGRTIGAFDAAPYRALWQLTPGEHQAQAVIVLAGGERIQGDPISFHVSGRAQ